MNEENPSILPNVATDEDALGVPRLFSQITLSSLKTWGKANGRLDSMELFSLGVLGATLASYMVRAFAEAPPQSVGQFLHDSSERKNTVALVASNVTVGTGLGYLFSGGRLNGILMLTVPIGLIIGYRFLSSVPYVIA